MQGVCDTPRRNDCHDAIARNGIIAIIEFIASGRIAYAHIAFIEFLR